eukprot:TRINITY_DN34369_c0_g1_i1.p1 TRINITY_DN34369_c0_g1~~TRINITY_DN34369_c0_g1_i1.p1  ORF type:complete len:228 (-),score=22.03 TRINITY_DN34369_c0_g1_i1:246-908(-)
MSAKLLSPAFERNKEPIWKAMQNTTLLGTDKGERIHLLELGSGPGQHVAWFAQRSPKGVIWQPSDVGELEVKSCDAYAQEEGLLLSGTGTNTEKRNILPALQIDVSSPADSWPTEPNHYQGCTALNVFHIVSAEAVEKLFVGASRSLCSGGLLVVYDTWTYDGEYVGPNNQKFSEALQAKGYGGVRSIEECDKWAAANGMERVSVQYLPANNQLVCWRKK